MAFYLNAINQCAQVFGMVNLISKFNKEALVGLDRPTEWLGRYQKFLVILGELIMILFLLFVLEITFFLRLLRPLIASS